MDEQQSEAAEERPVAASEPEPAHAATATTGDPAGAEPVTRLVLVVLGLAVVALAIWWLSPPEEALPPVDPPPDAPGAQPMPDFEPPLLITVIGGIDDRYFPEPCSRIVGGGLLAVRAGVDVGKAEVLDNHLGVSMGDLSVVPGPPGIGSLEILLNDVLPFTGMDLVGAGVGELQHGTRFARGALATAAETTILCANALDAEGLGVLRGWAVTSSGDHSVLTVAVMAASLEKELVALGSDIRLGPPSEYAARALADGRARAVDMGHPPMTTLLLVQGTPDEAESVAAATPGFDLVIASRGGVLPERAPRRVDEALVFYPGRGARLAWQLIVGGDGEDGARHRLLRLGDRVASLGSPYESMLVSVGGRLMEFGFPNLRTEDTRHVDPRGAYVGSATCAECHPDEAVAHAASPHARTIAETEEGPLAGSPACIGCHTTGAFHAGGWMPGDADGLAGVSCEACHGPAASHVMEPGVGYGAVDLALCMRCHLPDRSPGFDPEAAWAAAGHGALPGAREESRDDGR